MEQKKSTQKRHQLLNAALDVFSLYGFNGASLDEIAQLAEMHKSNIFYYYENKEALYVEVLTTVLQKWLAPLQMLEAELEPTEAITNYLMQKIELSRTQPKASRLFALEIIQGAPHILEILKGPLKKLVKRKAKVITMWQEQGKISADIDPAKETNDLYLDIIDSAFDLLNTIPSLLSENNTPIEIIFSPHSFGFVILAVVALDSITRRRLSVSDEFPRIS